MRKVSFAVTAMAVVLSAPVFAQDAKPAPPPAAGDSGAGIPDIVVTAQKRSENLQNVPIAISAFTASALKERAVGNVAQLSNISPNVTLDSSTPFSGSAGVLGASIRGVGSADFAFNIDPAVGVYLDGVYLARSAGANQDLLDVDRIEVLKGPQGTLFGRNTIGGAISIVTHEPGDEFKVTADFTTGSYRRLQARALVDLPISDHLTSSLAFGIINREGYQKRIPFPYSGSYVTDGSNAYTASGYGTGDGRQGGDNSYSIRGKLKWDNGAGFKAVLSGDYTNTDQDTSPNTVLATTEYIPGNFGGTAANNIPGTAFDPSGTSGFLFAGLYNFCIGSTTAQIAARNATALCGPRSGVNGYNTINGLASANVSGNPLTARLPYTMAIAGTGNIDTTYANGLNFSKMQQGGASLTLDADLASFIHVKSISAYRKVNYASGNDLDGSVTENFQLSFSVKQQQYSQELQFTGKLLDDRLNYVIGAYAFKEDGDLHDYVDFASGLLQVDGPGRVKTVNYAGYGQFDFRVNDLIGLTFGGRYTHEDKTYHGFQSDLNGFNYKLFNCPPSPACAAALGFPNPSYSFFDYYPTQPDKQTFNNFSPKAGIQLHPTKDLMGYFSWSRGYRTGGWTTRLSNPLPVAPTFGPEHAETFEVGIKSTLLDHRLQLDGAIFQTDYNGIQLNFEQGVSPVIQNAGAARIKGAELQVNAAPGGGFSVEGSLSYLDAYYTSVNAFAQVAPSVFQLGVEPGSALPKAPHWKINLSPRYEFPLGLGRMVLIADWTHTTSLRNDTEGTILLLRPTTDIVNISATWKSPSGHYDIAVGGTNVTNERYLVSGQAQIAGGEIYGTYDRPAEVYARLSVRY